jgi:hypothetical protein
MITTVVNILKKLKAICCRILNGSKTTCRGIAEKKVWLAKFTQHLEPQNPPRESGFWNPNPEWEKPPPFAGTTA